MDHVDSKSSQPGETPGFLANFFNRRDNKMSSDNKKRYYRKKTELLRLVDKMKLWPSRSGVLHGIKEIDHRGDYAIITTHCGQTFTVRDSRNSRAARWLRNKWVTKPCPNCKIPEWKLEKYSKTFFSDRYGSSLKEHK